MTSTYSSTQLSVRLPLKVLQALDKKVEELQKKEKWRKVTRAGVIVEIITAVLMRGAIPWKS